MKPRRCKGGSTVARFDQCLNVILRFEGGLSDVRGDKGGLTNCGITQATYDQFRKDSSLLSRSVAQITPDEISSIYKTYYWFAAKCHLLPEPLDLYTFDAAVQHGPGRAVKQLQTALGTDADGQLGPKTIEALQEEVKAGQIRELADHLIAIRLDFYHAIVDHDPSQVKFIAGWESRIDKLRRLA